MEFEHEKDKFFNTLGEGKKMVLATSANNRTTARMMSCVIIDGLIYIQTDINLLKYKQITENPLVALCWENTQLEGYATIKGHPFEPANKEFCLMYKKLYPSSFEKYTHLKNEMVIQIAPTLITQWCYDNGKPFTKTISYSNESVDISYYDISE